ncbi:MAG: protein DA1 [Stygiobacter sp.]|nr:MAG: hypothetical protein A2X62_12060 [Stygiobacter sp. GWC2_38_9]OGV06048.1 MAG: hypothetical protein A2299_07500 [Stygiobacter sp. RIFOXYB2_FULL_37_11]OGV13109.1 MAG: hypothetical protein A2237_19050 [Stygiobacter sp. RIFOXYA2_FULL_38_8]OGV16888.1 MAG: hypothetical protein A2440_06015 [Stygiobacter sp. RIFOXYC2_FULL_38_25]OGV82761.1 MAG: hypothetical protein A2X65_12140 [Stygiobacter sp. GWF2_38_21]RJQ60099.1 MAG: protein DA1 [Stygiobacter sp.]
MAIGSNYVRILQLLLLLNASIAFGQSIICSSCNKEVEGDYLKIGNKYFHPDHFVCDYCKKLLPDRFMSDNSKYYHSECYAEVKGLKCEYCKKIIADEYMISQNKKYHKRCYEQISPKCRICDKTLVGTFSVDYYGNKYHSYHENEFPRCTCCHRLISKSITNGGRNYSDGRSICNICFSDAIFDQGRISGLLEKVRSKLSSMGIPIPSSQISISGVSVTELKRVAGDYFSDDVKGFCETSILTTNKNQTKYSHKIYILNGLPAINLESIIAHELLHVWIAQNTKRVLSKSVTEGSCNYVSYLYLVSQNSTLLVKQLIDKIEKDPSPVYGGGFRTIRNKFANKSISLFLSYLRNGE